MSVFGALNRFISRLDSEAPRPSSSPAFRGTFGFQVLRNKNLEIPLEPWFDFVVGINGRQIDDPDPYLFTTEVHNCAGSTVVLSVYNAKGQRLRDLHLPIPSPSPTLGLTLQWTPLNITTNVWHILDVIPNSPADNAGLLPYSDYVIGTPDGLVHGESGLGELVEDYLSRPLRLFVYNHEYSVTRLVTLTPSRNWGGEGALGCVLGFGHLHQLPVPLTEPPAAPGDTLFEAARFSNEETRTASPSQPYMVPQHDMPRHDSPSLFSPRDTTGFLVPANMQTPPPMTNSGATVPARSSRKARHAGVSPSRAFDDYFKEGEKKSQEEDFIPSTGKTNAPPPPPKAGSEIQQGDKGEEEKAVDEEAEQAV